MTKTHSYVTATSTVADYQRDGAVVLRGVLSAEQVVLLQQGIEHNLANLSPLAQVASKGDDPGKFIEDFCTWQSNPAYESILRHSALPDVAKALMQSQSVRIYHDHLLVKEPGTKQITPWHQDQPYYNVSGKQNVSFWIPVDPVPVESTLRLVAGSHTGTWYMPRSFRDNQAKWFPDGTLAELPAIEAETEKYRQLAWALQPGDAVAFHMLALHGSSGVSPLNRRRVFSARYLGDDTRHAVRPWRTSPPFAGLSERLAHGAVMEDGLFPLVVNQSVAHAEVVAAFRRAQADAAHKFELIQAAARKGPRAIQAATETAAKAAKRRDSYAKTLSALGVEIKD